MPAGKIAAVRLTVALDGETNTEINYQALTGTFQFKFSGKGSKMTFTHRHNSQNTSTLTNIVATLIRHSWFREPWGWPLPPGGNQHRHHPCGQTAQKIGGAK